jgi:AcrR family transcriptional regulator
MTARPPAAAQSRTCATPTGDAGGTRRRTPAAPARKDRSHTPVHHAAFAEFLEHGYARGTTASVARRAGLSKVTLFRYFDTKEALFEAVMQRHIASATLALQSSPMQDNERGRLLAARRSPGHGRDRQQRPPATARLVIAEGLEFPQLAQMYRRTAHEPLVARIRGLAELAQSRGELKEPACWTTPSCCWARCGWP